jgi:hypothetical protein
MAAHSDLAALHATLAHLLLDARKERRHGRCIDADARRRQRDQPSKRHRSPRVACHAGAAGDQQVREIGRDR